MTVIVTKINEPYYVIPSVQSFEKTLKKWEGYYDPIAIRQRKTLLTHAYTAHKPKEKHD